MKQYRNLYKLQKEPSLESMIETEENKERGEKNIFSNDLIRVEIVIQKQGKKNAYHQTKKE